MLEQSFIVKSYWWGVGPFYLNSLHLFYERTSINPFSSCNNQHNTVITVCWKHTNLHTHIAHTQKQRGLCTRIIMLQTSSLSYLLTCLSLSMVMASPVPGGGSGLLINLAKENQSKLLNVDFSMKTQIYFKR